MGDFEMWFLLNRCSGASLGEDCMWGGFLYLSQLKYFITHNCFIKIKQLKLTLETLPLTGYHLLELACSDVVRDGD